MSEPYKRQMQCALCHAGTLVPTKVYRMHRAVVAVGYVIAVLSLAFISWSLWVVIHTPSDFEILNFDELESAHVPVATIRRVLEWSPMPESDLAALTSEQIAVVDKSRLAVFKAEMRFVTEGFRGVWFAVAGVILAVGATTSFLLTLRKPVLRCDACRAVIWMSAAASAQQ